MNKGEYLETLGFPRSSNPSHDDVKKAWKKLCHEHHPDKGGDENKFREVTHAYKMLTDISYQTKHEMADKVDLDLKVQFPLTFEEAFVGKTVVISYSVTEIGSDNKPIHKENVETETVTVEIPEGSFDCGSIVEPGKGIRKGDRRGDLVLIPMNIPHQMFTAAKKPGYWAFWDILSKKAVPLHALITGEKVDVLTMNGIHKVKIPPGSKPGDMLRIPNKGCKGGDHVVILDVMYPDKKELKSSKWSSMNIDWNEDERDKEEENLMDVFRRVAK